MMNWRDHPGAPAPGTRLCAATSLDEGAVAEAVLGEGTTAFRAVVLRVDDGVRAYVNLCPHFRIPLNSHGKFLMTDGLLWCGFHSAQFRWDDGYCVDGPCKGASLDAIPVTLTGGDVIVADQGSNA